MPEQAHSMSYWICQHCGESNHISRLSCTECNAEKRAVEFMSPRDPSALSERIQAMRLHNVTIQNAFQYQHASKTSYEHMLEILVIALAETADTLQRTILDYLRNAPPAPIYVSKDALGGLQFTKDEIKP